jgi:hypothetical protein
MRSQDHSGVLATANLKRKLRCARDSKLFLVFLFKLVLGARIRGMNLFYFFTGCKLSVEVPQRVFAYQSTARCVPSNLELRCM